MSPTPAEYAYLPLDHDIIATSGAVTLESEDGSHPSAPHVLVSVPRGKRREELGRQLAEAGFRAHFTRAFPTSHQPRFPYCATLVSLNASSSDLANKCAEFRRFRKGALVLIGSSLTGSDVIEVLEAGADDCIPGLASSRELISRLRAITRVYKKDDQPGRFLARTYDANNLSFDFIVRRVSNNFGKEIKLAHNEAKLLHCMLGNPGIVLSRRRLLRLAGLPLYRNSPRSVDVIVCRLRKKIACLSDHAMILTFHREGYKLDAEVAEQGLLKEL